MTTLIRDLAPGEDISGRVHSCARCGTLFIGRKDAIYCSNACRVAAKRASDKEASE